MRLPRGSIPLMIAVGLLLFVVGREYKARPVTPAAGLSGEPKATAPSAAEQPELTPEEEAKIDEGAAQIREMLDRGALDDPDQLRSR